MEDLQNDAEAYLSSLGRCLTDGASARGRALRSAAAAKANSYRWEFGEKNRN